MTLKVEELLVGQRYRVTYRNAGTGTENYVVMVFRRLRPTATDWSADLVGTTHTLYGSEIISMEVYQGPEQERDLALKALMEEVQRQDPMYNDAIPAQEGVFSRFERWVRATYGDLFFAYYIHNTYDLWYARQPGAAALPGEGDGKV